MNEAAICREYVRPRLEAAGWDDEAHPIVEQKSFTDVIMLEAPGGKERTEAEYRALLEAAGFELTQLIPVLSPYYLLEAARL